MLRLGLDLGTNSIGWALYRLDADGEPEALVDGGVLIHPDGRDPQSRASNAAERREKRGMRRNRDRTLRRRRRVARLLRRHGLLPTAADERARVRDLDPLRLRAESLDRALVPYELGRALLAFTDRRGFKSNRQADGGEDGAIRKDTGELRRRMAQAGARTLGEYLWGRRSRGKTIRARLGNGLYPDRAMIELELGKIRDAQAPHHRRIAEDDWDEITGAVTFQRKLRPVERGRCTLMPDRPRAFRAYPLFQRFRIRYEVRNIKVTTPGERERELDHDERELLVAALLGSKERKFEQIVKLLGLPDGTRVNLRTVARDKIDGDQTGAVLRAKKCFGKAGWSKLSLERQQEIVERLIEDEDAGALEDWLQDEFGLSEAAAEAVAGARLPQGTGHLSKAAIERLLPHMRRGLRYDEAVQAAGLGHHSDLHGDGGMDRLPYYGAVLERHVIPGRPGGRNDAERHGRVANPTVHIALGQVRRLFNTIADRYGKPGEVVVELARALKQNEEQRWDSQRRQRDNRDRNDHLRELADKAGHPDPSPADMRKLRLWEEQGPANARVCPFTGAPLSIGRVLSDATEVEHLLPFSRSLDNSMNNCVLAMRAANREKGNRSPFEAWGHDRARYDAILERAHLLPPAKQWRFAEDAMERWESSRDFLDRQMNENSYLSRLVREYLEAAVDPKRIWVTPGRMTALLRRGWGLNSILSGVNDWKNRDDHRHHLVDAAVIGMTSRSLLQKVATASGRGEDPAARIIKAVEPPWEGFRQDVESVVDRCVVRHRPDHFRPSDGGTSGSFHNETAYVIVAGPDEQGMMTLVETKPLDALDSKKLSTIRDAALRHWLQTLWKRVEAEGAGESAKVQWGRFTERARKEHGVRRVRVLSVAGQDSLALIRDDAGRVYKAYKTDGNAYMDVWLLPSGKTVGETINRFDAHNRANYFDAERRNYRSKVKADHPRAKKLMRLHRDDMVAIGKGVELRILRVKELSGQKIILVEHQQAGEAKEMRLVNMRATRVLKEGLRKVTVDVTGRVQDGGPFGPDGRGRG